MRAQGLLLAVLARGASAHWDAGERRDGLEEWRHPHRKRCDMFASVFREPHGAPAYVEGSWVVSTDELKGVTQVVPMDCVEESVTT